MQKDTTNYMVIGFALGYSESLVIPMEEGVTLMNSLKNAKVYIQEYSKDSSIKNIKQSDIKSGMISSEEYNELINKLLTNHDNI